VPFTVLMVVRNCACGVRINWQYCTFRHSPVKVGNLRQI